MNQIIREKNELGVFAGKKDPAFYIQPLTHTGGI
jgi:hypothetical protein